MVGKRKNDTPTPQVAAHRARNLKGYHKKKEANPDFLKNEADRKAKIRAMQVKVTFPDRLVPGDTAMLFSYGKEAVGKLTGFREKVADVASGITAAYKDKNAHGLAKTDVDQAPGLSAEAREWEEDGQVSREGEKLRSDSLSLAPENGFKGENPIKSTLQTLLEIWGLSEFLEALMNREPSPSCLADLVYVEYDDLVGMGMTPLQANKFLHCVNGNSLDVSKFMPPGVIHKEYSELSNACKFIEQELVGLGADPADTFGGKFAYVRRHMRSKTKKCVKKVLGLRNDVAHKYLCGNYEAARTSRPEFFSLVQRAVELLDIAVEEREEYQEESRKRKKRNSYHDGASKKRRTSYDNRRRSY